ncbi:MAG: single-stranded DNA-binding protein [Frankiaceae bacterium]|nr:single-stranded DNA-binding protein [Frankiaceae bacterium]
MTAALETDVPRSLEVTHRNEVVIVGRMSTDAVLRELPSGDEVATWRLIVDRPDNVSGRFDVVECATFNGRVRRQAIAWNPDDVIEVTGALRRRFWKSPVGLQNKYEVHVKRAARLYAAPVKRQQTRE